MTNENELDKQLEKVFEQDVTKGEKHYAKQFRSVYSTIRKSLVVLDKARKNVYKGGSRKEVNGKIQVKKGTLSRKAIGSNREVCMKLKAILEKAILDLE